MDPLTVLLAVRFGRIVLDDRPSSIVALWLRLLLCLSSFCVLLGLVSLLAPRT